MMIIISFFFNNMEEINEINLSEMKKDLLGKVLDKKRFLILGAKNTGKSTTAL